STTELLPQSQIVILAFGCRKSSLLNCFWLFRQNHSSPSVRQSARRLKHYHSRSLLISDINILNEAPVTARVDLNVLDQFICNDHIRRIPKRIEGQIAADYLPRLHI